MMVDLLRRFLDWRSERARLRLQLLALDAAPGRWHESLAQMRDRVAQAMAGDRIVETIAERDRRERLQRELRGDED